LRLFTKRFTGYNMLTKLILEHFKCFEKLHLELAPLTLLSGANATGKSTILQSLAILNQTSVEREWSKTLIFNASNTELGSAGDIIDKLTGQKIFKIGLHSHSFECLWTMKATDRLSLSAPIESISWRESGNNWDETIYNVKENNIHHLLPSAILESSENAKYLSDVLSNLTYISADRLGPRETYSATTPDLYKTVGSRGERTAWFLHHFEYRMPPESLILKVFPPTLQRQTEAWMGFFFPGTSFEIKPVSNANLITIGIKTSNATNFHRPQNVGYGLSSVLPIFAACLGANPGDLVMVENPEAHLSPSGQSEMGIFLAKTAAAGIQVMLETHSDHVLNGVRRAVKEKMIDEESVSIHFFIPRTQKDDSQVISPIMKKDGNLDSWPDGFFDQLDKDLAFLIGWEG